ncbi:MAG: Hsp20/alpha crystallin family protein [Hyphomicrobiaceae bacterium]
MAGTEISKGNGSRERQPIDMFDAMRSEMDRMLERFEYGWPRLPNVFSGSGFGRGGDIVPAVDVHDNPKSLTIEVELPGVTQKDVSVTLSNGILTIKGEKKSEREEKKDNYYMSERVSGSFERSLRLPDTVDENKLEAKFDSGVLKIIAQKKPEAMKAEKKIEIAKS